MNRPITKNPIKKCQYVTKISELIQSAVSKEYIDFDDSNKNIVEGLVGYVISVGSLEEIEFVLVNFNDGSEKFKEIISQRLLYNSTYQHSNCLEIIKLLGTNKADMHIQNDIALVKAAIYNQLDVIKYLRDCGLKVHTEDDNNDDAFYQAAVNGHWEIVKYFIECKIDITSTDTGNHALYTAVSNGELDMVKCLVEYGVDIKENGNKLMMTSIQKNHMDVAKYLLRKGVNVTNEHMVEYHKIKDIQK